MNKIHTILVRAAHGLIFYTWFFLGIGGIFVIISAIDNDDKFGFKIGLVACLIALVIHNIEKNLIRPKLWGKEEK